MTHCMGLFLIRNNNPHIQIGQARAAIVVAEGVSQAAVVKLPTNPKDPDWSTDVWPRDAMLEIKCIGSSQNFEGPEILVLERA